MPTMVECVWRPPIGKVIGLFNSFRNAAFSRFPSLGRPDRIPSDRRSHLRARARQSHVARPLNKRHHYHAYQREGQQEQFPYFGRQISIRFQSLGRASHTSTSVVDPESWQQQLSLCERIYLLLLLLLAAPAEARSRLIINDDDDFHDDDDDDSFARFASLMRDATCSRSVCVLVHKQQCSLRCASEYIYLICILTSSSGQARPGGGGQKSPTERTSKRLIINFVCCRCGGQKMNPRRAQRGERIRFESIFGPRRRCEHARLELAASSVRFRPTRGQSNRQTHPTDRPTD